MLYKNKLFLEETYIRRKMTMKKIGLLCNVGYNCIRYWLNYHNIKIRSKPEAIHLAKVKSCILFPKAIDWISGELLGDGCLRSKRFHSASFGYSSKYLEYINYITDTLKTFSIHQTGATKEKYHKDMNCYSYHYESCSYEELYEIYKYWYPKRKKIVPKDLKLTSLVCRQWYIGDGSLVHYKNNNPYIKLGTDGFSVSDVKWLVKQLNKLGFKSTRWLSSNRIHISVHSTKDFLDYIGKCPVECYQYKWNY